MITQKTNKTKKDRKAGKGYHYLPDIATADVAFEATGKTLEAMFTNAGLATEEVMVDLGTVQQKVKHALKIESNNVGNLLYEFLEELVFLKDKDLLLFNRFDLSIRKTKDRFLLAGTAYGEPINHQHHELQCDVKAVTLHMFTVQKTKSGWLARVVLDI